jgi:hypothetical protein
MRAGIAGGLVWVVLHYLLGTSPHTASVLEMLAGGGPERGHRLSSLAASGRRVLPSSWQCSHMFTYGGPVSVVLAFDYVVRLRRPATVTMWGRGPRGQRHTARPPDKPPLASPNTRSSLHPVRDQRAVKG